MGVFFALGIAAVFLLLPIRFCLAVNNARGLYIDGRVTYGPGFAACSYKASDGYQRTVVKVLGIPVYRFCPRKEDDGMQRVRITGVVYGMKAKRKMLGYLPGIARDIMKTTIGREALLRLKIGFEDPAYTGMMAGFLACILTYFGGALQYTPDFSGKNFEVDLYLKGVIIPVVLIIIGARHGFLYFKDIIFERNNVKGGRRFEFNG
jgi:hypothetical protein